MTKYVDKSAVVAEIERRIRELSQLEKASYEIGLCDAYKIVLSFIDTLEVKEVDEEYNGRAMLYVLEKGVKQGRRELIENACKWWEKELSYPSMTQEEIKWYKSKVNKFRKAMEE
jgi:hypothetical protein